MSFIKNINLFLLGQEYLGHCVCVCVYVCVCVCVYALLGLQDLGSLTRDAIQAPGSGSMKS